MEIQEKNGFSIIGFIAQVLVIVLFVFVLMWLFPTKSYLENKSGTAIDSTTANSAISEMLFNQNLLAMKDAAREYFTVKRMPSTEGNSKTLTLGEMIKNSMVVEFIDADGNKCSREDSYVKVTKVGSEYEMEVSLTCGKETKKIKTTIGCYNYCESGLCEKEEKPEITLYQYSKKIAASSKWSNWSEWSKTVVTKTSTKDVQTKIVNEKTGEKTVENVANATYSYSCPTGYELSADKKTCIGATKTIDATKNYYCVTGELQGTKCYLGERTEYEYTKIVCNAPGKISADGTKCETETILAAAKLGKYTTLDACKQAHGTCNASGVTGFYLYCTTGVLSGKQCVKKEYASLCPSGFKLTSNKTSCSRGYLVPNTVDARVEYTCSSGVQDDTKCLIKAADIASTVTVKYSCTTGTLNSKNKCESVVDVFSDVTYYRFRTLTTTKESISYKWSKSNNDTSLIKAGYKLTGKTKTSK